MTGQIQQDNNTIVKDMCATLDRYKTIVVTGDEGVGKITHSLEALKDTAHVFFIGNPLDFRGQARPGGYEPYLDQIRSIKPDLTIIATEKNVLSLLPAELSSQSATLLIDEVYGRSDAQRAKLYELIGTEGVKTVIVTGCMKNLHALIDLVDAGLMLTGKSTLFIDGEYSKKLCRHLQPESFVPEA